MTQEKDLAKTVSNQSVAKNKQPQKEKEQLLLEEFMETSPVFTSDFVLPFLQKKGILKNALRRNLEGLVNASSAYYGFNNNTNLINTYQGVLNIENRQVEPRNGRLFDRVLPAYDPKANAPAFEKLLNNYNTPDYPNLSDDLLKLFAYLLFGNNALKTFFIVYGNGNNAKTSLWQLVAHAVGDTDWGYSTKVDAKTFMNSTTNFNVGLPALNNGRLNYSDELKQGVELDGNLLKQTVAGEGSTVKFEEKGKKEQSTSNIISPIVFLANDIPNLKNDDQATLNRIALIEFTKVFVKNEPVAQNLMDQALSEQAGIFNMILNAYDPDWHIPKRWTDNAEEKVKEQVFEDEIIYHLTEALRLTVELTHDAEHKVRRAELHQSLKDNYYDRHNLKLPTKRELQKLLPAQFDIGVNGNYYTKILMK